MLSFAILKTVKGRGSTIVLEFNQDEIEHRLISGVKSRLGAIKKRFGRSYSEDEVVAALVASYRAVVDELKEKTVTIV